MWQHQAGRAGQIGGQFIKHIVPAILKPARALWNEVIGFIFLSLGVMFGFRTVSFARAGDTGRLLLMGAGTLLMLWYGVSSFLRARKISRS